MALASFLDFGRQWDQFQDIRHLNFLLPRIDKPMDFPPGVEYEFIREAV